MAKGQRKARSTKKASPRATSGSMDESGLTKGHLRKLNALRKSLGDDIAEKAFKAWLATAATVQDGPRDKGAEMIAEALAGLIETRGLRIPRGGYHVTRGRGRVIVTRPQAG